MLQLTHLAALRLIFHPETLVTLDLKVPDGFSPGGRRRTGRDGGEDGDVDIVELEGNVYVLPGE